MKKILLASAFVISFTNYAQIRTNSAPASTIANQSAFIDASGSTFNSSNNNGKGLVFPRTNLTTFQFAADGSGFSFATRYDGMIVYNTATGTTPAAGSGIRSGIGSQSVAPGFYYFSNPTSGSVVGNGQWLPLGSGAAGSVKDITATEVVLDKKIDGAQLYAIKGSFTADGVSAAVTITKPTGMTGYYSLTTYKDGKTFRNQIISFDTVAATENVVTGSGFMTEVYPAGTYNYVLEYFK